jgi:hypothetical protein
MNTKTVLAVSLSVVFAISMIFTSALVAEAAKPQAVVEWSNGFPSGEHSNLNIHGKKLDFNCDNSGEGVVDYGSSIFVPITGTSEIDFVSNKRSSLDHLKVIDPCAEPFGVAGNIDPALVQLPTGDQQVYWRILGKPNNNNGDPSEAMLTFPRLIDQCNFLPESFADGTIVNSFDPDVGTALISFNANELHVDSTANGSFDVGEAIYRDNDLSGTVSINDDRLANNTPLPSGTSVLAGDADIGTALISFGLNELHEDSTANGSFDVGETVYLDADGSLDVSTGDTRLANASSQGLSPDQGGDAINCEDETLVGLGLVTNTGVFKMTEEGLERFDTTSDTQGKGKSKAVNITDLFLWSGVVCDPSLDTNGDGQLTSDDFVGLTEAIIAGAGVVVDGNGFIEPAEFQAYLVTLGCVEFTDEWVFNIADIVIYGLDYDNKGTTLSQMRFYPTSTTDFIS